MEHQWKEGIFEVLDSEVYGEKGRTDYCTLCNCSRFVVLDLHGMEHIGKYNHGGGAASTTEEPACWGTSTPQ